ncbi:hypothetical protein TOT_040000725 [Theileria orientalis strain Shintoku]|uniref:Uncharacterized protein n=1 Tax=Theileria orientalis strain Shintoku TaxID=869250 RepID=J7M8J9_THEOR|nr:hypothetical protein TOT_040000725 [Theileria orientalis strain Shintoku]BAM42358.1 hypothetical protein TOT_040000725 [Theileria orientalis strain Shintoku]|eukprot:XP_009692659.1 hypothetical protein TOT_040000725 [Theileria orientalis strain Shintoku]
MGSNSCRDSRVECHQQRSAVADVGRARLRYLAQVTCWRNSRYLTLISAAAAS